MPYDADPQKDPRGSFFSHFPPEAPVTTEIRPKSDSPELGPWPEQDLVEQLCKAFQSLRFLQSEDQGQDLEQQRLRAERFLNQKLRDPLGPKSPVLCALLGGTNVGKSTVFNLMLDAPIACPSELARGTRAPVATVLASFADSLKASSLLQGYPRKVHSQAAELNQEHPHPTLYVHSHERPEMAKLVLIDAPDIDSNHSQNQDIARDLLDCCDAVIYVTSNQKYRDAVCEQLLAQAAQLSKKIFVVFNFAKTKAVEDFKKRFQTLTGRSLPTEQFVDIPHAKDSELREGPWVQKVRDFLPALQDDAEATRWQSRMGSLRATPRLFSELLRRYQLEVRVLTSLRQDLNDMALRRAQDFVEDTRRAGIPELDEVLTLVMKKHNVPGIDLIYDALFETTRSVLQTLKRWLGGADPRPIREARRQAEALRLRHHYHAALNDLREVFDGCDQPFRDGLREGLPERVWQRLGEDEWQELCERWFDIRQRVIESTRDQILEDLEQRKLVSTFIRAAKVAVRSASVLAIFTVGPVPVVDIAGSAVADLGLRSLLDKAFGRPYQKQLEASITASLRDHFQSVLEQRLLQPVLTSLPEKHSQADFRELEGLVEAVARAGRKTIEEPRL